MEHINLNKDIKTCGHVLFEVVGSNFGLECTDLRYMYLDVNKTKMSYTIKLSCS